MPKKTTDGKFSHASRAVIRHSYEQIVTRVARLSSFASCAVLPLWTDVMDRQEHLAIDDLVTLSIYVRRAAEVSGRYNSLRGAEMVTLQTTDDAPKLARPTPASIIGVINIIIHHQFMHLIRVDQKAEAKLADLKDGADVQDWMATLRNGITPAIIVQSDKGRMICFKVATFVDAVMDQIVEPLVEYCESKGLYLEHLDVE